MRLLTQKNSNSNHISEELDGVVDKEDIVGPSAQVKVCGYSEIKLSRLSRLTLGSWHSMKRSS
jgi:hypothetical protein